MPTRSIAPLEAFRALNQLVREPDDTEQAFRIVRAIDGGAIGRIHARLTSTEAGRSLLRDRPSLLSALADRDALAAMADGSLGRAYLEFCRAEGITPGGLVEASKISSNDELGPELRYVADRLRDSHDLWHLIAGYRTDLLGELCVVAFSFAQTRNTGLGLLAATGYLLTFKRWQTLGGQGRALAREALRRGRRAAWLPAVRWEDLLAEPLDEVRLRLGVGPAPSYAPIRATDLGLAS